MNVPISDDELIKMFEKDCKLRNLTQDSERVYVGNVSLYKWFLNQNGDDGLVDLNNTTLEEFVIYLREERKQKRKTIDNIFSSLNAFYDLLVYKGLMDKNIILAFRRRYLRRYKDEETIRKIPDLATMSKFINSIPKLRDRCIIVVFAKTGLRKSELISLDVNDFKWATQSIILKPKPKRSNRLVFFDFEADRILKRWMQVREDLGPRTQAMFIGPNGERLGRQGVYEAVTNWAKAFGLHNPQTGLTEDSFSPHSLRHWWTTQLDRGGMPWHLIQVLRGDAPREAIARYNHRDPEEIRQAYLRAVPELGII
jgi:integrase/recombinase XerD